MHTESTPRQLIKKLNEHMDKVDDPTLRQDMQESAETIDYLLKLLKECAGYIEAVKEYDVPPRFIVAVHEALS